MNRLQHETSPYLLQHKENPVDWYPWGPDALQAAQAADKPILLSVGYSACHWCHVMAHESFEDEATAAVMNDLFINIKVDREERPDIDDIYMQAVQAITGRGGWPMTVFLLPDGRPFYGGTYYPDKPRHGMPSFQQVLHSVHDAYANRRREVEDSADSLTDALKREVLGIGGEDSDLGLPLLNAALTKLRQLADRDNGGFSAAPKFPQPMTLEYLLRCYQRTGHHDVADILHLTLTRMARGGMYDQVGGGFARYSVDQIWLVPHFEKMLYDNAQLSRVYLHAWQLTDEPFYRHVAQDVYDYILREMTADAGGFYSATDADSEGEEGKFFVWTEAELEVALGDDAELAKDYWGITEGGNFEGKNILYIAESDEDIADRHHLTPAALREKVQAMRATLYQKRAERIPPGLDDKILASWNGMMLASLAEAARVLGRDDYRAAAIRAGEFLLNTMTADDGRLYRTSKNGESKLNGYLEDYANVIDAYLELYQTTFDDRWFKEARRLADVVLDQFAAPEAGFYDTSDDHETLVVRPRNLQDNAVPSGNTMIAKQFLRLSAYTGDSRYYDAARGILRLLVNAMHQYPQAFAEALNALDMMVRGLKEVALVGPLDDPATQHLLDVIRQPYRPNVITALAASDVEGETTIPLLNQRTMRNAEPTVYVCKNFACQMPVTTPAEVEKLL